MSLRRGQLCHLFRGGEVPEHVVGGAREAERVLDRPHLTILHHECPSAVAQECHGALLARAHDAHLDEGTIGQEHGAVVLEGQAQVTLASSRDIAAGQRLVLRGEKR